MADPLVLYPLRDLVLFPGQTETLRDMRVVGAAAVQRASDAGEALLCVAQKDPRAESPAAAELFDYGVVARIVSGEVGQMGYHTVTFEGLSRAHVLDARREGEAFVARWEPFESRGPEPDRDLVADVLLHARKVRERLMRSFPADFLIPTETKDPERTLDELAAALADEYARPPIKMKVLDKQDPSDRARVLLFLFKELLKPQPMAL